MCDSCFCQVLGRYLQDNSLFLFIELTLLLQGTFGKLISKALSIPHISTGDLIRNELKSNGPNKAMLAPLIEQGKLIPDDLMITMLMRELKEYSSDSGFILDGYPRTLEQAKLLDTKLNISSAVHITLDRSVTIAKLKGRLVCKGCGSGFNSAHIVTGRFNMPAINQEPSRCLKGESFCRAKGHLEPRDDDTDEVIKRRLDLFDVSISPLLQYYERSRRLKTFPVYSGISDTPQLINEMLRNNDGSSL